MTLLIEQASSKAEVWPCDDVKRHYMVVASALLTKNLSANLRKMTGFPNASIIIEARSFPQYFLHFTIACLLVYLETFQTACTLLFFMTFSLLKPNFDFTNVMIPLSEILL